MSMMQTQHYPRRMDLTGARVMITWATHGIGRACAWRFYEMNCQLVLVDHDEGRLQQLAEELMAWHQNNNFSWKPHFPELIRFDMTECNRVHEMASQLGPIDILINNAGMFMNCEMADMMKPDEMWQMVQTNYMTPMAFVSAFSPMMKSRGTGHIINICSRAKDDHYPNGSVYCSTKAAMYAYTCAARHDLVDTPVRVTSISPGMMDSSWYDQKWNSSEGRMFDNFVPMFPEDVADQIIYCCTCPRHVQISDISSYATNQSYFSMKGVPPVARMGMSLGAEGRNGENWQQWQQGWGDWNMGMMKSMGNMGMGMYNSGRNSPRMMSGTGNGSPTGFGGSPYNNDYSGNSMNDMNRMGSFRPGSSQHQQMGGMSGEHWKYNKPGYGSPYGSPRGSMGNMPHGSMA
jgi:NADP-dependent 3-hydroxy acid dehydrogenase YdfG